MKFRLQHVLAAIVFLILFGLTSVQNVFAEGEFQTNVNSVYTINPSGLSSVTHSFTVTNLTPSYYISKYGYQTSLPGITDVSVLVDGNPVEPQVVKTDEKTSISFSFPDEVVGEGKQRHFSIRYSSPVFATTTGAVLEVTIPKTQKSTSYSQSRVTVRIPKQYGEPYRIEPSPDSTTAEGAWTDFIYDQETAEGVSAVFGDHQRYSLDLTYYLDNPQSYRVSTEITLPPDTRFQRVIYSELDPRPVSLNLDGDGNWIATYNLDPSEQVVVHAKATAQLTIQPQDQYLKVVPDARWVRSQEYWETNAEVINELSQTYQTPRAMYQASVDLLDYSKVELTADRIRYGALDSLTHAQDAVCQEFTDLFIALARHNDIPARRATGYAFTNQPELRPLSFDVDVLHTWPEFYDQAAEAWHPIDPTWDDTTGGVDYFQYFDLNHIVFAYNGLSSTLPPPAGVYKPVDSTQQTVDVQITSNFVEPDPSFSISFQPFDFHGITIPAIQTIAVTNDTGAAWYDLDLKLAGETKSIEPLWLSTKPFPTVLLPFGQEKRMVLLTTNRWLPETDTIVVELSSQTGPNHYASSQAPALIIPIILTKVEFYFGLAILCSVSALLTGSVLVLRHKRQIVIRRQSQEPQTPPDELQPKTS